LLSYYLIGPMDDNKEKDKKNQLFETVVEENQTDPSSKTDENLVPEEVPPEVTSPQEPIIEEKVA